MRRSLLLFVAGVLFVLSGCASGYTRVSKVPEGNLGKYLAVEVPDLVGSAEVPEEVRKGIPDKIAKQLLEDKVFPRVIRNESDMQGQVLLIKGQVVQYNPGSRAMRYLAGPLLGTGKGSVIVNIKFIDKTNGKDIAEANFEGEIKGGVFGGGFDDTYNKVATEAMQFIKANL